MTKTIRGVELARVGTFSLSTGSHTFSRAQLLSAAANALRKPPRLKIGHTDPRFDGEPALGLVRNVRLSDDGDVLLGDFADVPDWLADALPSRYPDRSIEATCKGDEMRLSGVALLGATSPGIDSLADLELALTAAAQPGAVAVLASSTRMFPPIKEIEMHQVKEREAALSAAVAEGKMRDDYKPRMRRYWDESPTKAKTILAAMAPGVIHIADRWKASEARVAASESRELGSTLSSPAREPGVTVITTVHDEMGMPSLKTSDGRTVVEGSHRMQDYVHPGLARIDGVLTYHGYGVEMSNGQRCVRTDAGLEPIASFEASGGSPEDLGFAAHRHSLLTPGERARLDREGRR